MTRYLITLALAIAAALLTPHAKAEKVIVYREGELVNPQDVADVLGKTRSIRLLDDAPAGPAKPTTTAAVSLANTKAGSSATASARHNPRPKPRRCPCRYASLSAPLTSFRPHGSSWTLWPKASSCLHREASSRSKATPTPSAAMPTTSSYRERALTQCVAIWWSATASTPHA